MKAMMLHLEETSPKTRKPVTGDSGGGNSRGLVDVKPIEFI